MRTSWVLGSLFVLLLVSGLTAQQRPLALFEGEEITITGEVVEINHPILVLQDEEGRKYLVRLGPYWFWKKRKYHLKPGAKVKVIGFKRGKFVFPRLIRQDHQVLRFRDQRGFPLWRPRR